MFSYVEEMRKWGLFTMSKTYGVRVKGKGSTSTSSSGTNTGTDQEDGKDIVGLDDVYPLHKLVEILCYQDLDEARAACQHYSLAVVEDHHHSKEYQGGGGGAGPVVLWKASRFKEPRDPKKGTHLSLKPLKMVRTIEAKLQGATRLAICRGQVSGAGATLDSDTSGTTGIAPARRMRVAATATTPWTPSSANLTMSPEEIIIAAQVVAGQPQAQAPDADAQRRQIQLQQLQQQQEETKARVAAMRAQQAAHLKMMAKQKAEAAAEAEQIRLEQEEVERQRARAAAAAAEQERQRQLQLRLQQEQAAEALRLQKEEEERQRRAEAARLQAAEARRRLEEEEEAERKRLQAEAEEQERKRHQQQQLLRRQHEQEMQLQREQAAERQRLAQLQEQERQRMELEQLWQDKVTQARRQLALKLWRRAFYLKQRHRESRKSWSELDPTFTLTSSDTLLVPRLLMEHHEHEHGASTSASTSNTALIATTNKVPLSSSSRYIHHQTCEYYDARFFRDLAMPMAARDEERASRPAAIINAASQLASYVRAGGTHDGSGTVTLCSVAIVFPRNKTFTFTSTSARNSSSNANENANAIKQWISARLGGFNIAQSSPDNQVRLVFVDHTADANASSTLVEGEGASAYDAAIFVATPNVDENEANGPMFDTVPFADSLRCKAVLELMDVYTSMDEEPHSHPHSNSTSRRWNINKTQEEQAQDAQNIPISFQARAHEAFREELDEALAECVQHVMKTCGRFLTVNARNVNAPPPFAVAPVSLTSISLQVIHDVIWNVNIADTSNAADQQQNNNNTNNCNLVQVTSRCLQCLSQVLGQLGDQVRQSPYCHWPPSAFASSGGGSVNVIPNYFGSGSDNNPTSNKNDLPVDWLDLLYEENVMHALTHLFSPHLFGTAGMMHDDEEQEDTAASLDRLIQDVLVVKNTNNTKCLMLASVDVVHDCKALLEAQKYRVCLERLLDCMTSSASAQDKNNHKNNHNNHKNVLYIPASVSVQDLIDEASQRVLEQVTGVVGASNANNAASFHPHHLTRLLEWKEFRGGGGGGVGDAGDERRIENNDDEALTKEATTPNNKQWLLTEHGESVATSMSRGGGLGDMQTPSPSVTHSASRRRKKESPHPRPTSATGSIKRHRHLAFGGSKGKKGQQQQEPSQPMLMANSNMSRNNNGDESSKNMIGVMKKKKSRTSTSTSTAEVVPTYSSDYQKSKSMTAELEALLHGDGTYDMALGNTTLAALLQSTPAIRNRKVS
jgi:hypothetical protein